MGNEGKLNGGAIGRVWVLSWGIAVEACSFTGTGEDDFEDKKVVVEATALLCHSGSLAFFSLTATAITGRLGTRVDGGFWASPLVFSINTVDKAFVAFVGAEEVGAATGGGEKTTTSLS